MSNTKLQAARELIQEKRYAEARAILESMPGDVTAQKWLAQLERLSPRKRRSAPLIAGIAVFIVLILGTIAVVVAILSNQREQTAIVARQATEAMEILQAGLASSTSVAQLNMTNDAIVNLTQTGVVENFNLTLTALAPTETPSATLTLTPSPTYTATATLTPTFTLTPSITLTASATRTITPTKTVGPTRTPAPPPTLRPTNPPPEGSRGNPIPNGYGIRFPGLGTLFSQSSWSSGQTGLAIVSLTFTCERPPEQSCNTGDFLLDAVGSSGSVYERVFEMSIPEPSFGSFMNPEVFGGGTTTGYAGFRITNSESSLQMRVRLLFQNDETFFSLN